MHDVTHWGAAALPALFQSLVDNISDGVLVTEAEPIDGDPAGPKIVYVNPAFTRITGYPPEEIIGCTPRILQSPDSDRNVLARIHLALRQRRPIDVELLNVRKDGSPFWVELNISPIADELGRFTHWLAVQRDVTGRKRREDQALSELHRTSPGADDSAPASDRAPNIAPIAIAITTPTGRILRVNSPLCTMLGRSARELTAGELSDLCHPDDRQVLDEIWRQLPEEGSTGCLFQLRFSHPDGGIRELRVTASLAPGGDGTSDQVTMHLEDVTDRLESRARLTHHALHDPLTELPNRALLLDRLTHALAASGREETGVAVLLLDLDNFKVVNDTLGQIAGDFVLVTVARRLEKLLRAGDTAARFGGDEFVLICVGSEAEQALEIARRVATAVAEPISFDGNQILITVSIGIAAAAGADRADRLITDADTAMCRAKQAGRSRYELFGELPRSRAKLRLASEAKLRSGIQRGQLRLHYQPEIALDSQVVVGREALVRWQHPTHGLLMPADFLDVAERTGLIDQLSGWVLEHACRQQARWRKSDESPAVVWINLSARQIRDVHLSATIIATLERFGLQPADLGLEISERLMMNAFEHTVGNLLAVRDLGVRMALDNFGTGFSSPNALQRFPVDTLKIDRSFISELDRPESRQQSHAVVAALVGLAHALGLRVIAQGVETRAQIEQLQRMGCDIAQGFYFAPGEPAL